MGMSRSSRHATKLGGRRLTIPHRTRGYEHRHAVVNLAFHEIFRAAPVPAPRGAAVTPP